MVVIKLIAYYASEWLSLMDQAREGYILKVNFLGERSKGLLDCLKKYQNCLEFLKIIGFLLKLTIAQYNILKLVTSEFA